MSAEDYEGAYASDDPKNPAYAEGMLDWADDLRKRMKEEPEAFRGEHLAADEWEAHLEQVKEAARELRDAE